MGRGGGGGGSRGGGSHSSSSSRGGSFRSSGSSSRRSSSSYSSHRSSSSFSSSRRGGMSSGPRMGGGFPPPPPPPPRVHYHAPRVYVGGTPTRGVGVVRRAVRMYVMIIMLVVVIMVGMGIMGSLAGGGASGVTKSTIDRVPLDKQYTNLTGEWFDDSAMGWIRSSSTVDSGLRYFYDKTGVVPYLVIIDQIDGTYYPTGQQVYDYANEVFDRKLFDEGHMVFVFQCMDNGDEYNMAAVTGAMAKTVVDNEALEILYDYMDSYFYSNKSDDDMFADAFRDAADRMMVKTPNYTFKYIRLLILLVVILVIAFIVIKVIKHKKEETEATERILSTPIEQIQANDQAEDIASKYE